MENCDFMKTVLRDKVIYGFCSTQNPVEYVKLGETVLLETEDALGGQIKDEETSLEQLDWSKVDGATGPIFVEGAELGDTLVVNVQRIKTKNKGVIVVIPKKGLLGNRRRFRATTKVFEINKGYVDFGNKIRVKANPMIGTIGVAPETGEVPTATPGRHGGNMDVKEIVAGTRLFLPVFTSGALFAAGDLHAVQADGEICISAAEVSGQILLTFDVIEGKTIPWPILETQDCYLFLTCGESLDEASILAVEAAVEALMREYNWSFEKAYMFASLVVDLRINQVVDPKKGVRAAIPKNMISIESLFSEHR